ncbi:MAG: site-2 protease family protein [bacterium]
MLNLLFSSPFSFIILAASLVIAITIHEFAHALAADKLGDPTPRSLGRLTLNPLAHLDPLGTLAILFVGFGWGKPVPFDPFNLRDRRRDGAIISLAGPLSNLALALIISLLIKFTPLIAFSAILIPLLMLNVSLAVFNLVPVYPLDGEKILLGLLPADLAANFAEIMQQYGTLILILLLFPFSGNSAISSIIEPLKTAIINFLL